MVWDVPPSEPPCEPVEGDEAVVDDDSASGVLAVGVCASCVAGEEVAAVDDAG